MAEQTSFDSRASSSSDDTEEALASDFDSETSFTLLKDLRNVDSSTFGEFTDQDFGMMADILSVIKFEVGEKVVAKGEDATFCAIVLAGTFSAVINPTLSFPIEKGNLVGEMAYFQTSSTRSADIVCSKPGKICTAIDAEEDSENEEAVLAVITYHQIKKLGDLPQTKTLMGKIQNLLATISIRKLLHSQSKKSQERTEKKDDEGATNKDAKKGSLPKSKPKSESLFKNRRGKKRGANRSNAYFIKFKKATEEAEARQVRAETERLELIAACQKLQAQNDRLQELHQSTQADLTDLTRSTRESDLKKTYEITQLKEMLDAEHRKSERASDKLSELSQSLQLRFAENQDLRQRLTDITASGLLEEFDLEKEQANRKQQVEEALKRESKGKIKDTKLQAALIKTLLEDISHLKTEMSAISMTVENKEKEIEALKKKLKLNHWSQNWKMMHINRSAKLSKQSSRRFEQILRYFVIKQLVRSYRSNKGLFAMFDELSLIIGRILMDTRKWPIDAQKEVHRSLRGEDVMEIKSEDDLRRFTVLRRKRLKAATVKQPFSLRTQFATQELAHEVDQLKDIISQVNEMSETQRTASKAFFARTLELNRHSDDLKKKQAEIHAHYSEWKQDLLRQSQEERASNLSAPSVRKRKEREVERASEEKRMDAAAAELRKKVKEEKQRLLELQRLNSSLEREAVALETRLSTTEQRVGTSVEADRKDTLPEISEASRSSELDNSARAQAHQLMKELQMKNPPRGSASAYSERSSRTTRASVGEDSPYARKSYSARQSYAAAAPPSARRSTSKSPRNSRMSVRHASNPG